MTFNHEEIRVLRELEVEEFHKLLDFFELIILFQISEGYKHEEIASRLSLTRRRVEQILKNIRKKISLFFDN